MFSTKSNCPVPCDQQPLNEYVSLKKSFLFSWSVSSKKSFMFGLSLLFLLCFIFFCIFLETFGSIGELSQLFLLDLFISNLFIFFVLIRLYLGWSYVVKRLLSATVFYEESGWYDGQVWIKTYDYLMQDKLIGIYEVMPVILRIKYTCLLVCINLAIIYLFIFIF
uniref:Ycf36 n=1 Tax=Polysiphonia sp. TaxID=1967842 RepID=A0A1Z1M4A3_9FLOR|nr:hypothetical protein [Polysiphonia sp.]